VEVEFDEPSYEDLQEQVSALELTGAQQLAVIAEQAATIADLQARLSDLEQRLRRNPRNSSMPPSAEGFAKPPAPNRAARRAAKRRPGKQPGSEGNHLAQVDNPDVVLLHAPNLCEGCGADLSTAEVLSTERRQVFDLPVVRAVVTEHQIERRRCSCGFETKATAPREATAPACYGAGVRSLACYLAVYQHLPYDRMAKLFADTFSIEVSTGALVQMVADAGQGLSGFTDAVRDQLQRSGSVHFDETGGRVAGSLHFVHVASNALLTLLDCHKRRGNVAMDEIGVIGAMSGICVHDGWTPYASYTNATHALCNAHHLRELEFVTTECSQAWAAEMAALLLEMKAAVARARARDQSSLDPRLLGRYLARYDAIVTTGVHSNPPPTRTGKAGRPARTKPANLARRLDVQRDDVLRFALDFRAPFDNNQAERDIRMVKLQQKISGSWRTLTGARNYCALRSYISTIRKHNYDVLSGLRQLVEGQAWLPGST
jgi:transposase